MTDWSNHLRCILYQTESVPIATYNQLLDANQCTMAAVRDKSRAAADQMNAAAKKAELAIRCLLFDYDRITIFKHLFMS